MENRSVEQIKSEICEFRNQYSHFISIRSVDPDGRLTQIELQEQEPRITNYILNILGEANFAYGLSLNRQLLSRRDLLTNALLDNRGRLDELVLSDLNRAIGKIEDGLWVPSSQNPILIIKNDQLRDRCLDLLSASGNYDRVITEATKVLEVRIREKCPLGLLDQIIPIQNDRYGVQLIQKLFKPSTPVLCFSDVQSKRVALFHMLLGVFGYLRNPYHHNIDSNTEWSWAWSVVGLIDSLLADIDSCTVSAHS